MHEMKDLSGRVVKHLMRMRRRLGKGYESLGIIDRLLARHLTTQNRIGLLVLKINELRLRDETDETLKAVQEYLSLVPKQPEPWMMLANFYREDARDPKMAVLVSDVALAIAKLDGNFVRQALGERMRSLLAANRTNEANACLQQLSNYKPTKTSIDIDFEDDFLSICNASLLDQNIVSSYRALLR